MQDLLRDMNGLPSNEPLPDLHQADVLAISYRGDFAENHHLGWAMAVNADGKTLYQTHSAHNLMIFMRSTAKPAQAMPLIISGLHTQLTEEELALCCASHSGSAKHLELALRILERAGLDETALQCGPHTPFDEAEAHRLIRADQRPRTIHNNCSGKHAGMLWVCVHNGWPLNNYLSPSHPLQQQISKVIEQACQLSSPPPVAVDGCGAPCYRVSLDAAARFYAHLSVAEPFSPLAQAMIKHPQIVGAEGRIDTALMEASGGKLLAKVGADGVMGVARMGCGEGLFVKIADGTMTVRDRVIVNLLDHLGWLDNATKAHPALSAYQSLTLSNTQNQPCGRLALFCP